MKSGLSPAAAVAALLALGVGVAGYALTGSPQQPSRPAARAQNDVRFTPEAEKASPSLMNNYGDVRAWLTLSDALIRAGRTETAVVALGHATEAIPGNVNLWVQTGIALVAHADGQVVPAARLAFDRASRLAPAHPAPPYFLGLAWMQAGRPAEALKPWQMLDARTPEDAPFKGLLGEQIAAARMMLAMETASGSDQVQLLLDSPQVSGLNGADNQGEQQ